MPRYDVPCKLTGTDGNAFAIIGAVQKALNKAGASKEEISSFYDEATSGDYDNVIQTSMRWVNVS